MTAPGSGRSDDVSAELRQRVMQAVRAEPKQAVARRRSRRLPFAGALALAGVLGLAASGRVDVRSGGFPARVIPASVGQARLRVSGGRAELIVAHLPQLPAGRVYQLWLQRGASAPTPSTLFTVTSRGKAEVGVPDYAAGLTRALVTAEPRGGSRAPTSRPVIVASLV